jgi:hypothetical protein
MFHCGRQNKGYPVRKLPLLLLFVAVVAGAASNWLRVGKSPRAEVYVDTLSVERPFEHLKFWTLLQYKARQSGGWISERRLFLFSCKSHSLEWQQSMYYADSMGDGELLDVHTLNKYGNDDLVAREFDPSTSEGKSNYKEAVPESAFVDVFQSMC